MADQYRMQDPTTQYPKLDIPEQRQDEPGLDAKLQPKADHGEETYKGSGRLAGRKALVTGADSGIGAAVAIAFAREGADVCMNYLESEAEDAGRIAALLEEAGTKVVRCPGDISTESFCQKLVQTAVDGLGGLDIVVNNAGRQLFCKDILELSSEQWQSTFDTNISAMFWISKAAIPHLPAGAAIINTTSIQAYRPSPTLIDYATTKAAIVGFTHALGKQLAPKGIRVNAVGTRAGLDATATKLRPAYGKARQVWPAIRLRARRTTGRTRSRLCVSRFTRVELYGRRSYRRDRWQPLTLNGTVVTII